MVGVTLELRLPDDRDDDRHSLHSVASTVATTTSLASRIRELNLFEEDKETDKDGDRTLHSPLPEDPEQEHAETLCNVASEEEVGRAGALSEEDLSVSHNLHLLQREPPLQVCCRLFERRSHPPLPLKRMTMLQVEDFRQHGYVVIDNFISKEAAARIKAEALRLRQRGLLQPASLAQIGILAQHATNINLNLQQSRSRQAAASNLSNSPCSTCSSNYNQSAAGQSLKSGSHSSTSSSTGHSGVQHQHQQQGQAVAGSHQQQQQRWAELRLPLSLGHPPVDTAVFAPVMAALQDLQDDLCEFMRLRGKGSAEYCLCELSAAAAAVPRHKDALADDGRTSTSAAPAIAATSQQQQLPNGSSEAVDLQQDLTDSMSAQQQQQVQQQARRVSIFVFVNHDWDRDHGGGLRLWPPQRPVGTSSAAVSAAARRSPTSSDAGTTFSEISDCGSLRTPWLGSTTSSVIAEASAPDHDTYSLDGVSVADSEAERQGFEWVECEGGEMVLDVAPLAGRVVIGLSGALEYALLPSSGQGPGADMVFVRAWCG